MTPMSTPPDPSSMEGNIGVDHNQRVYVIHTGEAAEVISWDEVADKVYLYATELLIDPPTVPVGSIVAYDTMLNLQAMLKARFEKTGEQAASELSRGLSGLEGKRVKVLDRLDRGGECREFIVGISDGWLPHHIEVRPDGPPARAHAEYERVWVEGEDF